MPKLESLLERLISRNIAFVVVGGYAAVAHGVTLLTEDIDICCSFDSDNLLRLQETISDLNPMHRQVMKQRPLMLTLENCKSLKNLYLSTDMGQLDCLSQITGVGDYERVKQESIQVELFGGQCRILSVDALIKAKQHMHREKDKETVLQLLTIKERLEKDN